MNKHKTTGTEVSSYANDSVEEYDEEDDQGFIVGGRRLLKPVKINDNDNDESVDESFQAIQYFAP